MRFVYNSNSTMHLPALMQIRVAKETGWDGIFVRQEHLRRYLAQGFTAASLREALAGLEPVNLGALADVERWRPDEHAAMLRDAAALTELAVDVGASYVQLLTGPVTPGGAYTGPATLSRSKLREVTANAIRSVADLGARHGVHSLSANWALPVKLRGACGPPATLQQSPGPFHGCPVRQRFPEWTRRRIGRSDPPSSP